MTTTILARDLKPGDVIDFGGQPAAIVAAEPHADVPDVMQVKFSGLWTRIPDAYGIVSMSADLPLNVQRPDPDAELIEVIAKAIFVSDGCKHWQGPESHPAYMNNAKDALAAAREAGLL